MHLSACFPRSSRIPFLEVQPSGKQRHSTLRIDQPHSWLGISCYWYMSPWGEKAKALGFPGLCLLTQGSSRAGGWRQHRPPPTLGASGSRGHSSSWAGLQQEVPLSTPVTPTCCQALPALSGALAGVARHEHLEGGLGRWALPWAAYQCSGTCPDAATAMTPQDASDSCGLIICFWFKIILILIYGNHEGLTGNSFILKSLIYLDAQGDMDQGLFYFLFIKLQVPGSKQKAKTRILHLVNGSK